MASESQAPDCAMTHFRVFKQNCIFACYIFNAITYLLVTFLTKLCIFNEIAYLLITLLQTCPVSGPALPQSSCQSVQTCRGQSWDLDPGRCNPKVRARDQTELFFGRGAHACIVLAHARLHSKPFMGISPKQTRHPAPSGGSRPLSSRRSEVADACHQGAGLLLCVE